MVTTFRDAFNDIASLISKAKAEHGLSEATLLDLMKTQLVYGQIPVSQEHDTSPHVHVITGEETEFNDTEDESDDSDVEDAKPRLN